VNTYNRARFRIDHKSYSCRIDQALSSRLRTCGLGGVILATLLAFAASAAAQSVTTYHNDIARTGQYLNETILTPSNVTVSTFGKVGFFPVDGLVDAQTLYLSAVSIPGQGVHNVLYAATEHDSVYAFDAASGAVLWQASLLGKGETTSDDRGCGQVTPEIGITATPVIDPTRGPSGALYVIAMSKDSSGNYLQRLHALDITNGSELFGGPATVQASFPGTGDNSSGGNVIFDPKQYKERPGLLLLNGQIYTTWSSHCDFRPYTSWVMSFDASTLARTSVLNLVPNGSDGGIWMSGTGPAADASGNIYFLEGNGTFDTTLDANGFPAQGDFGNAFMKLSTSSSLHVADYFTMSNTVSESGSDQDLGSGGALVLPDLIDGSGKVRHLALGAGKDGIIYVVDRDKMGKFDPSANHDYQEVTALSGSVFSMPAYFNNTVYFGAVGDHIKAFSIRSAQLSQNPTSQTANSFGYPGVTPAVSANGSSNAIVWGVENRSTAVLHAYDATNLGTELYNSNQAASGRDHFGTGNKFITPMIANGMVYVGTQIGVAVFGLLGPPTVYVDAPTSGATVSGIVTISGWAVDNASAVGTGISSVQVKVDGTVVGTATYGLSRPDVCAVYPGRPGCPNVGYSYSLNTSTLSVGSHTITVTATDSDTAPDSGSASVTVTVQVTPPTVWIDVPAAGSMVSGTVTVVGWVIDNTSAVGTTISSVQVKVDGAVVGTATYGLSRPDVCAVYPGRPGCPNVGYSYSLNTSTLSVGSHTITVTATDSDGTPDSGSSSVTVTAKVTPPTVWIDAPTQGSTVSGTVRVAGWAIDNSSTVGTAISSLQVKVDGSVVGAATYGLSRPDVCAAFPGRPGCPNVGYSFSLNTASLSPGSHTITVTATDSDGTPDSGSSSVTVTVQATPPTVWIDAPTAGSIVSGTVMVVGWVIDNTSAVGTTISSVQVKVDGAVVGTATYGLSRPDVCAVYPARLGCPNVGYSFSLNTSTLSVGSHTITVTATDSDTTPDSGSASVTITK
jgi:hypothetical protein